MTFFRKIREWYYETMNMYRQISLDNKNRKLYLRTVREECIDPQSRFVKMNLKLADDLGYPASQLDIHHVLLDNPTIYLDDLSIGHDARGITVLVVVVKLRNLKGCPTRTGADVETGRMCQVNRIHHSARSDLCSQGNGGVVNVKQNKVDHAKSLSESRWSKPIVTSANPRACRIG